MISAVYLVKGYTLASFLRKFSDVMTFEKYSIDQNASGEIRVEAQFKSQKCQDVFELALKLEKVNVNYKKYRKEE